MVQDNDMMQQTCGVIEQLRSMMSALHDVAKVLLTEEKEKIAPVMPQLTQILNLVFPMVIQDYGLPAFQKRQEEIELWVALLGQIVATMGGEDTFAKIDILCAVLIPDLEEHISILRESGIA